MIDLHMHSTASDGSQTPTEIIRQCDQAGLSLNAITDHDTVDAQDEAIQASSQLGRPYLPGVEISTQHTGELHILGYGMDIHVSAFRRMMEELRLSRIERIGAILKALRKHGIRLEQEEVEMQAAGVTLGRPHVALALVARGYAATFREAFLKYLDEGAPGYVQRRKLRPQEAIDLIRSAGGIAVAAHPGLITTDDVGGLLEQLTAAGLSGIEAFYPAHSDAQVAAFCREAGRLGLIVTSGSDSHGAYRDAVVGGERRSGPQLEAALDVLMPLAVRPRTAPKSPR